MIVYKLTDRIPVKFAGVTVWVSPLSYQQKSHVLAQTKIVKGEEIQDHGQMVFLAVKYAVKEIQGLVDSSGSPYELAFDSDGTLTDACASDLMQMDAHPKLILACSHLMNGIKEYEIEGVEIDLSKVKPGDQPQKKGDAQAA